MKYHTPLLYILLCASPVFAQQADNSADRSCDAIASVIATEVGGSVAEDRKGRLRTARGNSDDLLAFVKLYEIMQCSPPQLRRELNRVLDRDAKLINPAPAMPEPAAAPVKRKNR